MHGLHGGEQLGPEQECSPNSLNIVNDLLGVLVSRGVEVPHSVVDILGGGRKAGQDRVAGMSRSSPGSASTSRVSQVVQDSVDVGNPDGLLGDRCVSFQEMDDYEGMDNEEDNESIAPQTGEGKFEIAVKVIQGLHPHSVPSFSRGTSKECDFERLFAVAGKDSKEPARLCLYHKVKEVNESVRDRFIANALNNRSLGLAMPGRRKKYSTPDCPSLAGAPIVNPNLARLSDPISSKRSLNFAYDDATKVEAAARHQLEVLSTSFWCMSSLVKSLKQGGYQPEDPVGFDSIIFNLTLSLVNNCFLASSISSFLQLKRRESLLAHFPPYIVSCHKNDLLASSMEHPVLFDPQVVDRVIREVKDDSSTSSMVALSKAALPSFSAMRSARKASPNIPAAGKDQAGSGVARGRGRTQQYQGQSVGRGLKGKSTASSTSSKSPKKSTYVGRGRGFTQ